MICVVCPFANDIFGHIYSWFPSELEINIVFLVSVYGVSNWSEFHAAYFSIVVLFFLLNVLLGLVSEPLWQTASKSFIFLNTLLPYH